MTKDEKSTDASVRPTLRIVRGTPSPEELAALTAVVAATSGGSDEQAPTVRRGGWSDPSILQRRRLSPGPNAWSASLR